jgi:hypothetical protein
MNRTIDRWLVALFAFVFAVTGLLVFLGKLPDTAMAPLVSALFAWMANPPKLGGAAQTTEMTQQTVVVTPEETPPITRREGSKP